MTRDRSSPPKPSGLFLKRETTTARNVAASYAGTVADGIAFLLLTPFLVRHLGVAAFGLWSLSLAFAEWLLLLDLGLREAVGKFAAGHQARSDVQALRKTTDTALSAYLVLAFLALTGMVIIIAYGVPLVLQDPLDISAVRAVFLVVGLSAAISLPAGVAGALLEGLSRFDVINILRIGHAVLRFALIVIAVRTGFGLLGLAVAELMSRLVLHLLRWIAIHRIHPSLVPRPRLDRDVLTGLLGIGLWNTVRQGAERATARICEPIVAYFLGPAAVGAFAMGRRLGTIPSEAIGPMTSVLFPLSSELQTSGRHQALRDMLMATTKYSFFAAMPLGLVLGLGAHAIQTNWLAGRVPEMEPILSIFSVVFLIEAVVLPSQGILLGLGRSRLLAMTTFAQLLIVVGIGLLLTPTLGGSGLALATLIAVALTTIILVPAVAHLCKLPLMRLIRRAILPPLVAGAPVSIGMFLLRDPLASGGLASLATWASAGVLLYVFIYWRIGFDMDERAFVRRHLARLLLARSEITNWDEQP